jgi:uroporphyrin-III C-methyltransferase
MNFLHRTTEGTAPAEPLPRRGLISLVGAGPGAADLLTLRAVRCLGQSDIIYYDRLVDPAALRHANPAAQQVFVGKEVGAHSWPQARIDAAIVAAALGGQRVVRLKSGDPMIFGRAAEEIAAARAHGIAVEVIPGITAAAAAAAQLCQPLTERGVTDRLVLATGTCRTADEAPDLAEIARPGATLVFYMAMKQLDALSNGLMACGVAAGQAVTVAAHVEKAQACHLETTVARLVADCQAAAVANPAVIILRLPKMAGGCDQNRHECVGQGAGMLADSR